MSERPRVVIVHGGAGNHAAIVGDSEARAATETGVVQAARIGYGILVAGGSSLDAVEAAVVSLEDNPTFNAGRGSCLTLEGTVEMDASIMEGTNLDAGSVVCVPNVTNPIRVARAIMEQSPVDAQLLWMCHLTITVDDNLLRSGRQSIAGWPEKANVDTVKRLSELGKELCNTKHVSLVGERATAFAEHIGETIVETAALVTEKARARLHSTAQFQSSRVREFYGQNINMSASAAAEDNHGTVGAVAVDGSGHVAYATSTGGINAKMPGRMGDSSIVGAGGYADNRSGAVSTTGDGEALMKICLGRHVTFLMEQGRSAQQAVDEGLAYMRERVGGSGGGIALTPSGDIGISYLTKGMSWAYVKGQDIHYGIYRGEDNTVAL